MTVRRFPFSALFRAALCCLTFCLAAFALPAHDALCATSGNDALCAASKNDAKDASSVNDAPGTAETRPATLESRLAGRRFTATRAFAGGI
ncbi:hypothetical protein LJC26_08505, partial [Desulfovibrio sp. OttesenSCG-928-O18]|nr:hypothetical protein [Desulfovibrio sp. OttesenSCG-928-O18]